MSRGRAERSHGAAGFDAMLARIAESGGDAWAKVPRAVLKDRRLTFLQFRVLVALLSYADPARPNHPVWAGPKRIAEDLGLSTERGTVDRVRGAVDELQGLGYLRRLSDAHRKIRLSLSPVLSLLPQPKRRQRETRPAGVPSSKGNPQAASASAAARSMHWNPVYAKAPDTLKTSVTNTLESSASNHPTNEHTNKPVSDQPEASPFGDAPPNGGAPGEGVCPHNRSGREEESVGCLGAPAHTSEHRDEEREAARAAKRREQLRQSLRLGEFSKAPAGTDYEVWESRRREYQRQQLRELGRKGPP